MTRPRTSTNRAVQPRQLRHVSAVVNAGHKCGLSRLLTLTLNIQPSVNCDCFMVESLLSPSLLLSALIYGGYAQNKVRCFTKLMLEFNFVRAS